tara:strand:- start:98 stop:1636 length:1539 start_codon:yes stop_codon:yes gene_type:complete
LSKKFYLEFVFLLFLGSITSLSLPPYNFLLINFITFTLFFIFLIRKTKKNKKLAFFYGWLFGFGYFVTNIYWITISLTFDETFKLLIPISILLVPGFLAIFYGFISYLFIIFKPKKIIASLFFFSLIFGLIEFVRGKILTGFPWNLIAYSFSNQLEILSITSILGTYGFNLFCISLFVSPALFFINNSKKDILLIIFFSLIIGFFYFYGSLKHSNFEKADIKKYSHKIRIIGSNINLDRFYHNVDPTFIITELIQISEPAKDEKIIFIWPEGILPSIYQDELNEYFQLFENKFNKNHFLVIGINSRSLGESEKKYFNSLAIYDHKLKLINSYSKINLVPFGEFLPFEKVLKRFGLKTIANDYQSFSRGSERKVIEINQENFSIKFLPLICYEIIYSGEIYENFDFDFIVNISEDGWFGNSIGPKQHFVHSIYRAIESGKYVLRSANNGIAAVVNPLGVIEKKVDYFNSGFVDFSHARKVQPTVFSKYGNKIFLLIILLYIFLIFSFIRINYE